MKNSLKNTKKVTKNETEEHTAARVTKRKRLLLEEQELDQELQEFSILPLTLKELQQVRQLIDDNQSLQEQLRRNDIQE